MSPSIPRAGTEENMAKLVFDHFFTNEDETGADTVTGAPIMIKHIHGASRLRAVMQAAGTWAGSSLAGTIEESATFGGAYTTIGTFAAMTVDGSEQINFTITPVATQALTEDTTQAPGKDAYNTMFIRGKSVFTGAPTNVDVRMVLECEVTKDPIIITTNAVGAELTNTVDVMLALKRST